jgi:hypothetical protein
MGHSPHLSRREILSSIPVLTGGSLLRPLHHMNGQRPDLRTPGVIRGALLDAASGQAVAAKIRVTNTANGAPYFPEHAIKTMPQRSPLVVSMSLRLTIPRRVGLHQSPLPLRNRGLLCWRRS